MPWVPISLLLYEGGAHSKEGAYSRERFSKWKKFTLKIS